jgi:hypothetical protein
MPGKIPVRMREAFKAHMDAHNRDDLPDGAWMEVLKEAAAKFIKRKKLMWIYDHDAVIQYLKMSGFQVTAGENVDQSSNASSEQVSGAVQSVPASFDDTKLLPVSSIKQV